MLSGHLSLTTLIGIVEAAQFVEFRDRSDAVSFFGFLKGGWLSAMNSGTFP
jgi:hypothetical protein